eukprot:13829331-Alexandrium_andersonii.AAC.1
MQYWGRKSDHLQHVASTLSRLRVEAMAEEQHQPVEFGSFRRAIAKFKNNEAAGVDHWSPAQLRSLPLQSLQALHGIVERARQDLELPLQARTNVVAMLAKPKGGERPIGLMSMFYRLVAKVDRFATVLQWEEGHAAFWDYAVKGSSALQGALARLVRAECAQVLGD